jgi:hypothetical protein
MSDLILFGDEDVNLGMLDEELDHNDKNQGTRHSVKNQNGTKKKIYYLFISYNSI